MSHIMYCLFNRKVELSLSCFDVDKTNPQWYHYFLCGYRGILEHFGLSGTRGLDMLCDGTIPCCAGLSSSSALVCCSSLVTMHAYDHQLSRVTDRSSIFGRKSAKLFPEFLLYYNSFTFRLLPILLLSIILLACFLL